MKTFEELEVYQKAVNFAVTIFTITEKGKFNRNIANQLERASLSISNNIAEGFELQSNKQLIKFLYISKGSCGECRNMLTIANRLNQLTESDCKKLKEQSIDISKQLSNFIKYLKKSEIQ